MNIDELFPTHIRRLVLTNHKCFYEKTEFEFGPEFNILVGENSSGKSTVLEAFDLSTGIYPHWTARNEASLGVRKNEPSEIEINFAMCPSVVAELTARSDIYIGNTLAATGQMFEIAEEEWHARTRLNQYLSFDVRKTTPHPEFLRLRLHDIESSWLETNGSPGPLCRSYELPEMKLIHQNVSGDQRLIWLSIRSLLSARTYRFATERRIAPSSGFSASPELTSDGSNLAFCLNHLKSHNGTLHRDLNRLIQHILPAVKSVNAVPDAASNTFIIRISHVDEDENRGDLAVGLAQVGTGVGNVIAMLYVALTAHHPRTILLEEPNSYLHPRALRELLAILADTDVKHQYFITTHSSDVLRSVKASTVTHLEYDGETSTRKQVTGSRIGELKAGLMDMGIRLSDLHGCDHVMWVEGQTEEAVFPLLIRKYFGVTASTVAVLRVHATSDFEGEVKAHHLDPVKVAEIYRKLSTGNALAPHMVGIVLDREGRHKTQCDKIETESKGLIHFLARPMLENYLLSPAAIAELIRERNDIGVSADEVTAKLETAKSIAECWIKPKAKASELHAAKALKYVCHELTEGKLEYSKTRDGPFLVEHLLRFEPGGLIELKKLLQTVLFGKQPG